MLEEVACNAGVFFKRGKRVRTVPSDKLSDSSFYKNKKHKGLEHARNINKEIQLLNQAVETHVRELCKEKGLDVAVVKAKILENLHQEQPYQVVSETELNAVLQLLSPNSTKESALQVLRLKEELSKLRNEDQVKDPTTQITEFFARFEIFDTPSGHAKRKQGPQHSPGSSHYPVPSAAKKVRSVTTNVTTDDVHHFNFSATLESSHLPKQEETRLQTNIPLVPCAVRPKRKRGVVFTNNKKKEEISSVLAYKGTMSRDLPSKKQRVVAANHSVAITTPQEFTTAAAVYPSLLETSNDYQQPLLQEEGEPSLQFTAVQETEKYRKRPTLHKLQTEEEEEGAMIQSVTGEK